LIAYNKYIVAHRIEEIIKTFNYFPTPEMIAQLNQELEPLGKIAANDLELYMKAKSEEFVNGLKELIAKKTAEAATNEAEKVGALASSPGEPVYISGQLLMKTPAAKNWSKIGIGKSEMGGRGVFALQEIKEGELLEEAPYITVPMDLLQVEPICDYLFTLDDERCAIVFGYGSMYNHKNQPNISYQCDPVKKNMCFYAKRDILPGEELTVTYGKDWFYSRGSQTK
jgi:uncharacterized protein